MEVVNAKSFDLPWSISVPMSDVDELKRSFGITTQYYQANIGNFRGKAVKWSGARTRHLMSEDIFRVYKSHDAGVEASDRPQLKMSALEGVVWFARRHAWHLVPKAACVPLLLFVGVPMVFDLSAMFADSAFKGGGQEQKNVVRSEAVKPFSVTKTEDAVFSGTEPVPPAVDVLVTETDEVQVVMLYEKGVMLNDGRKISVGDSFRYQTQEETLCSVCVECGLVMFLSGKRVYF